MSIEIKQVGITEQKERTWGRVYVDYVENGINKFAFKNWIYFKEENFIGDGSFENESAYTWFDSRKVIHNYEDVLDGLHDRMSLTSSNHKSDYGTPSKILLKLIQDLDGGFGNDIGGRRGWY